MDNDIENQITNKENKKICCLSCAVYTSITVLCVFAIHAFYKYNYCYNHFTYSNFH